MSQNLEIERTFLARYLPADLKNFPSHEIMDYYLPPGAEHAKLRIRKSDDKYTITKKELVNQEDESIQIEHNIELTTSEFNSFKNIAADTVHKIRYYYNGAELDLFLDDLQGLVLIDFEFDSVEQSLEFEAPDFCLAEVTKDNEIAGGLLCRHNIESLQSILNKYNYKLLSE